jgi:WD40 repeat protein
MVRLCDADTGICQRTFYGHTGDVLSVVVSPDGKQIASGSMDCTVRLWVAENGACCKTLEGHYAGVTGVAYSPQGHQLASSSGDATVRVWNIESGECRFILIGHSDELWCVAYSLKGDLIASAGGKDKTVRLWSTELGQCLAVLRNFQDTVRSVAWNTTSNATYLVTGCIEGSVLKWNVVEEGEEYHVNLHWSATNGLLTVTGASMKNVRGLSQLNKRLMRQRGAIDEPEHLLHEASKKVTTMASLASRLKQLVGPIVVESFPGEQDRQTHQRDDLEDSLV